MLEKFTAKKIKTSGAKINVKIAGDGPPVLFLHGYPQTHMIWHKVAPELYKLKCGLIFILISSETSKL